MPKKKYIEEEPEEVAEEEEEVTCPVCGKPVGIEVIACPYCGAEFEPEEEVEAEAEEEEPAVVAPVKAAPAAAPTEKYVEIEEEETAECPVCGKMVGLAVTSCPNCGAEFEEEEVEEIIEVEEKPTAKARTYEPEIEEVIEEVPAKEEVVEEEVEVEEEVAEMEGPSSILDFRVIGMSLIVLGVVGSQIAFMIDWYWTWVPPIEDNLGMFIAVPAVIIVVGLLAFLLVKRAVSGGRRMPGSVPGFALSLFLFGILALVMVMLWDPINSALQGSSVGVGAAFVILLVVGALVTYMGMRSGARASAG